MDRSYKQSLCIASFALSRGSVASTGRGKIMSGARIFPSPTVERSDRRNSDLQGSRNLQNRCLCLSATIICYPWITNVLMSRFPCSKVCVKIDKSIARICERIPKNEGHSSELITREYNPRIGTCLHPLKPKAIDGQDSVGLANTRE